MWWIKLIKSQFIWTKLTTELIAINPEWLFGGTEILSYHVDISYYVSSSIFHQLFKVFTSQCVCVFVCLLQCPILFKRQRQRVAPPWSRCRVKRAPKLISVPVHGSLIDHVPMTMWNSICSHEKIPEIVNRSMQTRHGTNRTFHRRTSIRCIQQRSSFTATIPTCFWRHWSKWKMVSDGRHSNDGSCLADGFDYFQNICSAVSTICSMWIGAYWRRHRVIPVRRTTRDTLANALPS